MYSDHLPNWFTAQEDRLRRQAVVRNAVLLAVGCLLALGLAVVVEPELVQVALEIEDPEIFAGSK